MRVGVAGCRPHDYRWRLAITHGHMSSPAVDQPTRPSSPPEGGQDERSSRFPSAPTIPPEPAPAPVAAPESAPLPAAAVVDSRQTFEEQLAQDILGAERFRATLLATIPTVALF